MGSRRDGAATAGPRAAAAPPARAGPRAAGPAPAGHTAPPASPPRGPHQPLEVLDHRVQGALLSRGRTAEDERRGLVGPTASYSSRTRRDLPIPASPPSSTTCPCPSWTCAQRSAQQPQFLLPSHQGRQAVRGWPPSKRTWHPAGRQHLIERQRLVQPFEGGGLQGL